MTKLTEKIIDVTTGEETIREYTEAETKEAEANLALAKAQIAAIQAETTAKEADKAALLTKLGITADEAKLLLS
jgi:hypothetical protein